MSEASEPFSGNRDQRELLQLDEGLNAIYMPDLGIRDHYGKIIYVSPEETMQKLHTFLEELNQQSIEVLAVVPVKVDTGRRLGALNNVIEEKYIFLVRRDGTQK